MVKIGIIGVGRISQKHIEQLQAAGNSQIVAICDIDKEKLESVGDRLNIAPELRFEDYRDLVNCPLVEAVEICTPNYLHVSMATYVAKAGKHVQIEKPIGICVDSSVEELVEAVEQNGVIAMMDFSYRFKDAVRYAKHLIDEGKLGKLINVNIQYKQSGSFIPGRRLEWRYVKEYSGSGALADLGVHLIDMTRFLIGEFKSIYAMQNTVIKERMRLDSDEYAPVEVDDLTSFIAKLDGDVIANFMVTRCSRCDGNTIVYELYGTDGVIRFNLNQPEELEICIGEIDCESGSVHKINVPPKYKLGEQECFVRTLHGEKLPYYPDIYDGVKSQLVVDAALKSAVTGEVVEL